MVHSVNIPPSQYWYCTLAITILFAAFLCSMLLIVSMTFDRFYSIIKPHKAASFNTVKRTKITIICIISFSITYSIPHLFVSSHNGWQCMPYGNALKKPYGQFYYWLSFTINFVVPFVSLLVMNSVIINTLRKRSRFIDTNSTEEGQGKDKGQGQITRSSERQVYAILLLVTFGFLILSTPAYMLFLYMMVVDFFASPATFATYYIFYNFAQKAQHSNHGINFFLYVISGTKFRTDLLRLFKCGTGNEQSSSSHCHDTMDTVASIADQ